MTSDEEIGDPPECLEAFEQDTWKEIVGLSLPGVLTRHDRVTVEIVARLLAEFRVNPQRFTAAKLARLEALLGRLGMSPADRSRVSARLPSQPNPFAINERKPA